jgi:hypothetical protein
MKKSDALIVPLRAKIINQKLAGGVPVKTDLRAGDWRCTSCQGEVFGSDLIKPKCDYCELF